MALQTVYLYTSITLLIHVLNWWYNTRPVCWVGSLNVAPAQNSEFGV